jgi:hypothetical protein
MADVRINVGTLAFRARFERDAAPLTCARFERILPYRECLIHVRWSGEACSTGPSEAFARGAESWNLARSTGESCIGGEREFGITRRHGSASG